MAFWDFIQRQFDPAGYSESRVNDILQQYGFQPPQAAAQTMQAMDVAGGPIHDRAGTYNPTVPIGDPNEMMARMSAVPGYSGLAAGLQNNIGNAQLEAMREQGALVRQQQAEKIKADIEQKRRDEITALNAEYSGKNPDMNYFKRMAVLDPSNPTVQSMQSGYNAIATDAAGNLLPPTQQQQITNKIQQDANNAVRDAARIAAGQKQTEFNQGQVLKEVGSNADITALSDLYNKGADVLTAPQLSTALSTAKVGGIPFTPSAATASLIKQYGGFINTALVKANRSDSTVTEQERQALTKLGLDLENPTIKPADKIKRIESYQQKLREDLAVKKSAHERMFGKPAAPTQRRRPITDHLPGR
jgi:hypothetical protein